MKLLFWVISISEIHSKAYTYLICIINTYTEFSFFELKSFECYWSCSSCVLSEIRAGFCVFALICCGAKFSSGSLWYPCTLMLKLQENCRKTILSLLAKSSPLELMLLVCLKGWATGGRHCILLSILEETDTVLKY